MSFKKIMIVLILFLLIGAVSASNDDILKAPAGYEDVVGGIGNNYDNDNLYIYVGEMEFNKDAFENKSDNVLTELEKNIYQFTDNKLNICGVQEKVKLDGKEYLVSIVDEGSSDGDIDSYLNSLKTFNKLNNLVPLDINV